MHWNILKCINALYINALSNVLPTPFQKGELRPAESL